MWHETLFTGTVFSISNVYRATEIEGRIRQNNQYKEEHQQHCCPLWRADQCTICGPSDNRRFHCKFWISLGIHTVADNATVKERDFTNRAVHRPSIVLNSFHELVLQDWSLLGRFSAMKSTAKITQRWSQMNEALLEWCWDGKTTLLWEKPVPVSVCLLQIPHWLAWVRTRASVVRSRWLTARIMPRPCPLVNSHPLCQEFPPSVLEIHRAKFGTHRPSCTASRPITKHFTVKAVRTSNLARAYLYLKLPTH